MVNKKNSKNFLELSSFASVSKEKYNPVSGIDFPCVELEHIEKETGVLKSHTQSLLQASIKNKFHSGDVLFGKLRPNLRKYAQPDFDGVCSTEIWVINANPQKCTKDFLFYLVQSEKFIQTACKTTGSKMPRADWELLSGEPFNLPPLEEQRKIATILRTWDDAIEKIDLLIGKKKYEKQLFQAKFFNRKKGEAETLQLRNVANKIGSGSTPRGGAEIYISSGIPFIRSQNVLFGSLDLSNVVFISDGIHNSMRGTWTQPGDVLLNITGASIGRSCTLPDNFSTSNVNQHVCIIRLTEKYDANFLSQYLNSSFGQFQINSAQGGGSRQGLNFEQIGDFQIPAIDLHQQKIFASVLQIWDDAVNKLYHSPYAASSWAL